MRDEVMKLLAVEQGHFGFESGHHGTTWMNLETLFLHPGRIEPLAAELADRLRSCGAEAVCGPLVEGAFLALMVARRLGLPFTYSERFEESAEQQLYPYGYRIPRMLHPHVRGKRVLIVNDVINAGSAVRGTATELEQLGATVVALGAMLVLGPWTARFAEEKRLQLAVLAEEKNELWEPAGCPLCASEVPLQRRIQQT
ncbi:MAG TPA: phosphoribosyltransferase family protein [Thermoanaerobaculia bacterium]|nr:phosphoribosyltransferase family protein [Thermoanaerobaculia bacterium]